MAAMQGVATPTWQTASSTPLSPFAAAACSHHSPSGSWSFCPRRPPALRSKAGASRGCEVFLLGAKHPGPPPTGASSASGFTDGACPPTPKKS
eukprot:4242659-Alexandrium_andersonii.AAC.1